jgi:hypothetical protein
MTDLERAAIAYADADLALTSICDEVSFDQKRLIELKNLWHEARVALIEQVNTVRSSQAQSNGLSVDAQDAPTEAAA